MQKLSEILFKELKKLYLMFLSYKLQDEKEVQKEVEAVIDFIAEANKFQEKLVFTWKISLFIKHLNEWDYSSLNHDSEALMRLLDECWKIYQSASIDRFKNSSKENDDQINEFTTKFIERFLTSIYLKIDRLSTNKGSISDSADNPQDMARVLDVLHRAYTIILKSFEVVVVELSQSSYSDELDDEINEINE